MNIDDFSAAVQSVLAHEGSEAEVVGIQWWHGTWELTVRVPRLEQSGVRSPELHTWDLKRREVAKVG